MKKVLNLPHISAKKKTGSESFIANTANTQYCLRDFWSWSFSDLVSNSTRGRLAEFIVATASRVDLNAVRGEWDAFDLVTEEGIKIEVKSAAFIQSWYQNDYSKIRFSIKQSHHWDSFTSKTSKKVTRNSDVYVFCLLKHKDQRTIDPLDLDQWEFYVLSVKTINKTLNNKSTVSLQVLRNLCNPISYQDIREAISQLST
jgi:hypothetical protein